METEAYWKAVTANDARFDGVFYLGVKTTGIYCRPSCRARTPKRENVAFFPTTESAEKFGLRACLRCKPQETKGVDPQIAKLLKACELLGKEDAIDLKLLAAELELSPFHLQKSFKEVFGVSPKKYSEVKRMERFKSELKSGSDVTRRVRRRLGSSSRLTAASEHLGMTPSEYKKAEGNEKLTIPIAARGLVARTIKACATSRSRTTEQLVTTNH